MRDVLQMLEETAWRVPFLSGAASARSTGITAQPPSRSRNGTGRKTARKRSRSSRTATRGSLTMGESMIPHENHSHSLRFSQGNGTQGDSQIDRALQVFLRDSQESERPDDPIPAAGADSLHLSQPVDIPQSRNLAILANLSSHRETRSLNRGDVCSVGSLPSQAERDSAFVRAASQHPTATHYTVLVDSSQLGVPAVAPDVESSQIELTESELDACGSLQLLQDGADSSGRLSQGVPESSSQALPNEDVPDCPAIQQSSSSATTSSPQSHGKTTASSEGAFLSASRSKGRANGALFVVADEDHRVATGQGNASGRTKPRAQSTTATREGTSQRRKRTAADPVSASRKKLPRKAGPRKDTPVSSRGSLALGPVGWSSGRPWTENETEVMVGLVEGGMKYARVADRLNEMFHTGRSQDTVRHKYNECSNRARQKGKWNKDEVLLLFDVLREVLGTGDRSAYFAQSSDIVSALRFKPITELFIQKATEAGLGGRSVKQVRYEYMHLFGLLVKRKSGSPSALSEYEEHIPILESMREIEKSFGADPTKGNEIRRKNLNKASS